MKIALLGSAPSSVNLAPFKDASYSQYLGGKPEPQYPPSDFIDEAWQIWGCSPGCFAVAPRFDVFFELHRWEPGQPWFSPEYVQFLRQFRGPVFTGGPIPDIPNHVVYPIERVEAEFSAYFLHSSLSLMAAVAILEIEDFRKANPDAPDDHTVGFWGVDMAADEEYGAQRSGCHFFILEALRRGIEVIVPPESCLLRPMPVYGLSEWDHAYIKQTTRMRELNARRTAAAQQAVDLQSQAQFLAGAADQLNYDIRTWMSPYGIPAGVKVKIQPGTGLGGGITMQKPADSVIDRMPVTEVAPPTPGHTLDCSSTGYDNPPSGGGVRGGITWIDEEYKSARTRKPKTKPKRKR